MNRNRSEAGAAAGVKQEQEHEWGRSISRGESAEQTRVRKD